mmetsp:Transcript_30970/g.47387  ORF Transcript_30970/g.47387 Transcript_30970/m.47387 type:complete len:80 (+) Transcript_30970:999-1238(+)
MIAVNEVYEAIKFQCNNCGMRFARNEKLKAHLDKHFYQNNEIRMKKPCYPSKQDNRPQFLGYKAWTKKLVNTLGPVALA